MILAHQIRLDPTMEQEAYFRRACGTARFTYNWALDAWRTAYASGQKPNGKALRKQFNAIRDTEYPWTYDVHRDSTARPFDDLQKAFSNFFAKRTRHPKFKKKGRCDDKFYVANDKVAFDGTRVRLPLVGWVRLTEALRFEGKIMGAVVRRKADQWHLSVQVDVGDAEKARTGNGVVGVDLGIKASVTLSTGEVLEGPKALKTHLGQLRRLSRGHSRKVKGGKNRQKSKMRLARLHLRIGNVRKDHLHKTTTRLCRENQAIGIEDLHVRGMVKLRNLARGVSDEGWGEFRRQLTYKAVLYGMEIVIHDRFYPSSKRCSGCGNVKKALSLSERQYVCEVCGLVMGRDHNAAVNLKPIRIPEANRGIEACGHESSGWFRKGSVKLPWMKQEPNRDEHFGSLGG